MVTDTTFDGKRIGISPLSLFCSMYIQYLLSKCLCDVFLPVSLFQTLLPDLLNADYAFAPLPPKPPPLDMLDKEIRAIFLRFFAEMYAGYRSCLTIIRIHPEPFITFHKVSSKTFIERISY